MKLTEQKCPACNGTLKIDEKNPHIAECEYCRSRYIVEWDHEIVHKITRKLGTLWKVLGRILRLPLLG